MSKELLAFYEKAYYHSLEDREVIQSRIRLFLYSSVSSLIFLFYINEKTNPVYLLSIDLTVLTSVIILIIHVPIFWYVILIFIMQTYSELPYPDDLEESRQARIKNGMIFDDNKIILEYYAKTATTNMALNQRRREMLGNLVIFYIALAAVLLVWITSYFLLS